MGTRPRPSIKDIRDIDNIMALVTREAQALESRLEWDLASRCSNYQQLLILKKNQGNEKGIQSASSCAGMTPRERLIWYRANQPAVELDTERCNQSSNYRQLMLARGVRAIEEVLRLDRRLHPGFPLHLPADVDLQAGVRRVRPIHR